MHLNVVVQESQMEGAAGQKPSHREKGCNYFGARIASGEKANSRCLLFVLSARKLLFGSTQAIPAKF